MALYGPDEPYEEDCDPECYTCIGIKRDLNTASDNLITLMKHLYDPDSFDEAEIEDSLRQLCDRLEVNFPKRNLQITSKK